MHLTSLRTASTHLHATYKLCEFNRLHQVCSAINNDTSITTIDPQFCSVHTSIMQFGRCAIHFPNASWEKVYMKNRPAIQSTQQQNVIEFT